MPKIQWTTVGVAVLATFAVLWYMRKRAEG